MRADPVHEVLRMTHEEQNLRPPREVVLEPEDGLHVLCGNDAVTKLPREARRLSHGPVDGVEVA